jgi:hypothetical protein
MSSYTFNYPFSEILMSKCGNIHGFPWTIHGTPTIHGAPTIHGNSMDSWSWNGGRFHGFHPVPPLSMVNGEKKRQQDC